MTTERTAFKIPRDSNLNYLPFVYFLPEDMFYKLPTLYKIPRELGGIIHDENMIKLIKSDQFLDDITDAIAMLILPHLGFGGKLNQFTGYSLVYFVACQTQLWVKLLEEVTGWGLNQLFKLKPTTTIHFFETDYIKNVMAQVAERGKNIEAIKNLLAVQREFPCDEDFEQVLSNVRIDFYRKWYHTRSKVGIMASLEEFLESDDGDYYSKVAVDPRNMAEVVASEDYCQRFKSMLSERDLKILELREDGYIFEEIAEKLGYKTHSAVVKRMQAIKEVFLEYEKKHK